MVLEKEQETFKREINRLAGEAAGKFALIHGDQVAGVFDTFQDAVKSGYEKFKLAPFMVKQILTMDRVHFFTRDLASCPK